MGSVVSRLVVRAAGPEDAATIAHLNNIVQAPHYEALPERFHEPDERRVESVFRQLLASDGQAPAGPAKAWLCVDDDDVAVGYVMAVLRERPENPFTKAMRCIELDQIAVLDDARRDGAGRLLVRTVIEWARHSGVDVVELSVWDFNEGAQAFFASLGFEPLSRRQCLSLPPTKAPGID
jgi:GNAT superfamily N-acetyltransferase